jgi:hypothetical protein
VHADCGRAWRTSWQRVAERIYRVGLHCNII